MSKVVKIPKEYWPDIEELPGDLTFIARGIEEHLPGDGVRITLLLAQIFKSQGLYFHSVKELLLQIRNDAIRKESADGAKVRELAYRFDLSTRWIEDILSRLDEKPEDKQMRLF